MIYIFTLSIEKINDRDVYVRGCRAFLDPVFHFCFQFFRSVDLSKVQDNSMPPTLNLNCMWAWLMLIYFGIFGQFMSNVVSRSRKLVIRNR